MQIIIHANKRALAEKIGVSHATLYAYLRGGVYYSGAKLREPTRKYIEEQIKIITNHDDQDQNR